VVDVEDVDGLFLVIDPVAHAVLTPARSPLALERLSKWCPDAVRVVGQRTEDELDACSRDRFRKLLGEPTRRAAGYDDPEAHSR
jgi:hypothetical protein